MRMPENVSDAYSKTIGSEKFEKVATNKLAIGASILTGLVGIGSALVLIDGSSEMRTQDVLGMAAQGAVATSVTASVAVANIRKLRRKG